MASFAGELMVIVGPDGPDDPDQFVVLTLGNGLMGTTRQVMRLDGVEVGWEQIQSALQASRLGVSAHYVPNTYGLLGPIELTTKPQSDMPDVKPLIV